MIRAPSRHELDALVALWLLCIAATFAVPAVEPIALAMICTLIILDNTES